MFKYKISIDKKIISILGPHLYGDMASIIAELVSNSYDADAENCWITIKTGEKPEIIIEDDGIGMTPNEVNKYFLDIGHDRRDKRPTTKKDRKVFGRKGIGKLAAFSLSKQVELYSLKDNKKTGCLLDYDKITKYKKDPISIPNKNIIFDPQKLSSNGTGTRLVLKDIKKNINTTYYYLLNRIIRNFNIDDFKIHIRKNDESFRTMIYTDLKFFDKMDTIVTIGRNYDRLCDQVRNNCIPNKFKDIFGYEDYLKTLKKPGMELPKPIEVLDKNGNKKKVNFTFSGWIGTIIDKKELDGLVKIDGANDAEIASISINDNRITIFSRNRVGEYDILPKVQTDTIYDSYVIGEIHVEVFEDDKFVDMAISNRRGYEESDIRYQTLISYLKSLVRFVTQKKDGVNEKRKNERDREESEKIKKEFTDKTRTMNILNEKLNITERDVIKNDNFQFVRAIRLGKNTKKIFISSNKENKEYGLFVMKIFELLGLNKTNFFIFTGDPLTGVPFGQNIYDYLKECFRDDIHVIFLFSKHFYDSNICIAETGAAWATNKNHTNIIIDVGFKDIDKPIDNAKIGLSISDINTIDRNEFAKFVKTVYEHINIQAPNDANIQIAITKAVKKFRTKLSSDGFCPRRKYQGHPLCNKCKNIMTLKNDTNLYYECENSSCRNKMEAKIK